MAPVLAKGEDLYCSYTEGGCLTHFRAFSRCAIFRRVIRRESMSIKTSVVIVLCLLFATFAFAEGVREYIYGGTGLIATEIADTICAYSISPSSASASAYGGSGYFSITHTSGSGCSWLAIRNVDWITITGTSSGTGNGTVSYSVAINYGPKRIGIISAGGQIYTVSQAGMTCHEICSIEAQNVINQTEADCQNNCLQWVLSEYPICASYPIGPCFDMLNGCTASCPQDAAQAGVYYYQQCTASCN